MELLTQYFEIEQKIRSHFKYNEPYVELPLCDMTDQFWFLVGESYGGFCVYSPELLGRDTIAAKNLESSPLYNHRHQQKAVYRADDYTLIALSNGMGSGSLSVFNNIRECRNPELIAFYNERW